MGSGNETIARSSQLVGYMIIIFAIMLYKYSMVKVAVPAITTCGHCICLQLTDFRVSSRDFLKGGEIKKFPGIMWGQA